MPRYIDADVAENLLLKGYELSDVPTANVQEVRHGKWIQNKYLKRIFYCSVCSRCVEGDSESKNVSESFPYCHCGAKMDLEEHEYEHK